MDFEVRRDDFRTTRTVDHENPSLADGQASLRVSRFALTANNVKYEVVGGNMSYWTFSRRVTACSISATLGRPRVATEMERWARSMRTASSPGSWAKTSATRSTRQSGGGASERLISGSGLLTATFRALVRTTSRRQHK